jgi:hypothetical protein
MLESESSGNQRMGVETSQKTRLRGYQLRPALKALTVRLTSSGGDFALLPQEDFGFHGAAVCAFEAVNCQISANWMRPDHVEL